MTEPRVLMRDKRTGKLVLFHVLPDGRFAVETRQDVEPILETNQVLRNAQSSGWKGDMHMVAKIDMPLWQSLRTEGRIQEVKDFKKWLNDSDHAKWRTKTGNL